MRWVVKCYLMEIQAMRFKKVMTHTHTHTHTVDLLLLLSKVSRVRNRKWKQQLDEGIETDIRQLRAGIGIGRRQQEAGTGIGKLLDMRACNKRTSLKKVKQLRRV